MAKKLRPFDPRNLGLVADLQLERAWRVEYFDSTALNTSLFLLASRRRCERATTTMQALQPDVIYLLAKFIADLFKSPHRLIAIVDDDPGMLKAIGRLLAAHSFRGFCA